MRLFMIFIALVVAVAAGIGFWLVTSQEQTEIVTTVPGVQPVAVEETSILVARRDIPVGHKITEQDIDRQTWPSGLVVADFVVAGNEAQLIDRVARTAFKQRQPLMLSFLANPNDPGFIAAQIPSGKRAITLPIDDVSGISGFIFPGDHVDVLVKHRVGLNEDYNNGESSGAPAGAEGGAGAPAQKVVSAIPLPLASAYKVPTLLAPGKLDAQPVLNVTEVLVANARVLAVGNITTQYQQEKSMPRTVTLEVSELQAQKLRHAEQGSLTLSLRSLDDINDTNTPRPVGDSDMSRLIPPAYFPHLYDGGDYKTEVMTLNEIDYDAPEKREDTSGIVNIFRGTQKEIVGVNHP